MTTETEDPPCNIKLYEILVNPNILKQLRNILNVLPLYMLIYFHYFDEKLGFPFKNIISNPMCFYGTERVI